ncbi:hypothetical protein HanRHA438_Chr05g0213931 [Helianthus annuus]|nr:hypothetical protein HanRHA438_Chr05g0213931 [Helianthus annuus]
MRNSVGKSVNRLYKTYHLPRSRVWGKQQHSDDKEMRQRREGMFIKAAFLLIAFTIDPPSVSVYIYVYIFLNGKFHTFLTPDRTSNGY